MKYTNKYKLPKSFYRAVVQNTYDLDKLDEKYISATALISPVRQSILKIRHWNELVEDVSDSGWRLFGEAMHYVVTKANQKDNIVEKRLEYKVDSIIVSGKPDIYIPTEKTIEDYKITSVWSVIYANHDDWEKQLNIYAFLHRVNGDKIEKLRVIAFLRDFNQRKALTELNYPESQIVEVPIKLWTLEEQEKYILDRVEKTLEARRLSDDKLPICTPEERWQTPNLYKVMKKGRKSAVKNFENKEDAIEFINNNKDKKLLSIKFFKGEDRKCLNYCPVKDFCNYYKEVYGNA